MPIMSLVSYLKDIKQQNKQIIKLIQCNDYLACDIDCIKNKIACEHSPTINLRFILQLVDTIVIYSGINIVYMILVTILQPCTRVCI